jgi:hypothetical protein
MSQQQQRRRRFQPYADEEKTNARLDAELQAFKEDPIYVKYKQEQERQKKFERREREDRQRRKDAEDREKNEEDQEAYEKSIGALGYDDLLHGTDVKSHITLKPAAGAAASGRATKCAHVDLTRETDDEEEEPEVDYKWGTDIFNMDADKRYLLEPLQEFLTQVPSFSMAVQLQNRLDFTVSDTLYGKAITKVLALAEMQRQNFRDNARIEYRSDATKHERLVANRACDPVLLWSPDSERVIASIASKYPADLILMMQHTAPSFELAFTLFIKSLDFESKPSIERIYLECAQTVARIEVLS